MTSQPSSLLEALQTKSVEIEPAERSRANAPHWKREQFIPLRKADLVRLLAEKMTDAEQEPFHRFCRLLESIFHHEFHQQLEALKNGYAPFNPDTVMKQPRQLAVQPQQEIARSFFRNIVEMLESANYQRLSQTQIEQAIDAASDWGMRLKVDFSVFEFLEVFARGDVLTTRTRKNWRKGFREEEVDVPIYQRLVVVFQLRDHPRVEKQVRTDAIYLKLFKNIPKQDVDMLLPGARLRMSLLDHGKVIVPTLSGLALAIAKGAKAAVLALFVGFWGVLAFAGFMVAVVGYGVKSILGYLRTKDKYQLSLTRNLYYQNLDTNAGVIYRLLDEAEEQEFREAILAYCFLRTEAGIDGWNAEALDRAVEAYLSDLLGFHVDFEVHDALEKLQRLGCIEDVHGRWRAVPLQQALVTMDRIWDGFW